MGYKGNRKYDGRSRGKKPDGARYKTGIYLITISVIGLILGFVLPWVKVLGDELLSALLDLAMGSMFIKSDFFVLLIAILISGIIILLISFFEDIELFSSIRSSWTRLVLGNILVILSILFILLSLYYLGVMISFNKLTIMSEEINGILFTPAPLSFIALGIISFNISMGAVKKEFSALKFKTKLEEKHKVKRPVKKPIKKPIKKSVKKGGD
ncbi:MAG: hypothetical protein ACQEQM_01370 [Thermoplasmatota archaeon]